MAASGGFGCRDTHDSFQKGGIGASRPRERFIQNVKT